MALDLHHKTSALIDQPVITTHRTDSSAVTLGVEVNVLEETKVNPLNQINIFKSSGNPFSNLFCR